MSNDRHRTLWLLAWLNVVLHFLGLVCAALWMRPGTPLVSLDERTSYLAAFPLGWMLGWGVWMLCALALVGFFFEMSRHLPAEDWRSYGAVVMVMMGGAFDLFADLLHIGLLPRLAAGNDLTRLGLFIFAEKSALGIGWVVANGAYTIATLLMTLAVRRAFPPATIVVLLGAAVFISGMGMTTCGLIPDVSLAAWGAAVATGPTIGFFCLWTVVVARHISASAAMR